MIDERYDNARIRQFASRAADLSEDDQKFMRDLFLGDESADFYHGLLAGVAYAFRMSHQQDRLLGIAVAFVADRIESKELV